MPRSFEMDIMLDYDEIVYPWAQTAHMLCQEAGVGLDYHTFSPTGYGISREEAYAILRPHILSGRLYMAEPIPGAAVAIRRMQYQGHRVHIVTARAKTSFTQPGSDTGEATMFYTFEQLRRDNIPFDSFQFAPGLKSDTGRYHLSLDDYVVNVADMADAGTISYMLTTPENRHLHVAYPRVDTVGEFADVVIELGRALAKSDSLVG